MSLSFRYFIIVGILHISLFIGGYFLFRASPLYFILIEVGVFLSLFAFIWLYRSMIRPIDFIRRGASALKDQDFNIKYLTTGVQEMDELIEVYNSMIDQLRKERTFQKEQHYFLEQIMNASPVAIVVLSLDEAVTFINPLARQIFNQLKLGDPFYKHNHALVRKLKNLASGAESIFTISGLEQFKCAKSSFLYQGFKRTFILISEMTKEVAETEKRAYGKVIRMMAHEVNNSIGAVNSILQTIRFHGEPNQVNLDPADINESLDVSIKRNEQLNQFMKNFADVIRLPDPELEELILQDWLKETVQVMDTTMSASDITMELQLPESPIYLHADPHLLSQALLNILKNAQEAIGDQGRIQILVESDPVQLIIRNDGMGISPHFQEKLFTPFYSTKEQGQGIGLAIIKEVLLKHDFRFTLATEADGWTYFRIWM